MATRREILEQVARGELRKTEAARQLRALGAMAPQPAAPVALVPSATVEEFNSRLRGMVAGALKIAPGQLDFDRPLSDYGLTSITVTALLQQMNAELGTNLAPTVIFEFSTPRAFSEHVFRLTKTLGPRSPANVKVSPPVPVSAPPSAAVASADIDSEMARLWADAERAVTGDRIPVPSPPRIIPAAVIARPPKDRPIDRIAIVGMAGVMPQCDDLEAFWDALVAGRNLVTEAPAERWNWRDFASVGEPGARWGGFIRNVECFDASYFGISPHEAKLMDPQQRIFLQTAWHALEDAGYRPADLAGSKTGVFVGVSTSDYFEAMRESDVEIEAHTSTGFAHSLLANRVSFLFDWRGPSQIVDTACSSSLIALHRAVQAMAAGDCTAALVGGVNLLLTPTMFVSFTRAGMLSPDGRCQAFDARANGYVRGEGAGAVLLKPLAQAEADGDHIYGVILSSAENHGGRATSLTAPNPAVQAELLVQAYTRAAIDPRTVGYIETHGTGTALGDPLEFTGLQRAFDELHRKSPAASPAAPHRCLLGSVKTNIGHLESAAGVAGLLKVLLALRHGYIPPNLHFRDCNPHVDFSNTPFAVAVRGETWERVRESDGSDAPRRAGVSSFGFGGAYAHVVLEEYQTGAPLDAREGDDDFVLISAGTDEQLHAVIERWLTQVRRWRSDNHVPAPRLTDVAATSRAGRISHACRVALRVRTLPELAAVLALVGRGAGDERILRAPETARPESNSPASGFVTDHGALVETGPREALVRRWCQGNAVAWRMGGARRVSLPLYSFELKRCWFDLSEGATQAPTESYPALMHYAAEWRGETLAISGAMQGRMAVFGSAAVIQALRVARTPPQGIEFVPCDDAANSPDGPSLDALTATLRGFVERGVSRFAFASESLLLALRAPSGSRLVFKERVRWNVARVVRLAQACAGVAADSRPVTLVQAFHSFGGVDTAREEAMAATLLSGYFENAAFVGHAVSFDRPELDADTVLQAVYAEGATVLAEPREVRYDAAGRSIRVLGECANSGHGLELRRGANYLIAGGLGEVGSRFAGWLAREYAATVVILGRREPGADTAARVAAIEAGEGRVYYHSGDVSDPEALALAVRAVKVAHGPIRGVFHLARAVEPGRLATKDEACWQRVTQAKVDGAIHLDAATAGEPLDFFVLFSSIAADWGVAGAADYAYACRFQNAFAAVRARWAKDGLRRGHSIAIGWPQWRYDAHSHAERDQFLESRGLALLDETAGFSWLARSLDPARSHAAFVVGDGERLRAMLSPAGRRAALAPAPAHADEAALRTLLAELSDGDLDALYAKYCTETARRDGSVARNAAGAAEKSPQSGVTTAPGEDAVRAAIRGVLSTVLHHAPTAITGAMHFERLGMDSILGVKIVQRLEKTLEIAIPPRWLIENPTVDGLTEKIRRDWLAACATRSP